jgi:ABC-2 type transport system ATP-binding protein
MIGIELRGATVDFPLVGPEFFSFKRSLLSLHRPLIEHVRAVNNVSLTIKEGERVGLIGANGAGKTSLLKVLAGIYPPTRGKVMIKGQVSALFDLTTGMDMELNGVENIKLRLMLLGYRGAKIDKMVEEVIDFAELGDFIHMPVRTYSSGMFVRLSFGICTVMAPEILVLDEFLGAGDAAFAKKAESKVRALMDSGNIVIVSSHALSGIVAECTRCIWIDKGRLRASGPPAEIVQDYLASTADVSEDQPV